MVTTSDGPCLVCLTPASIADWTPIQEWLTVEGCGCEGFFVSRNLWRSRLVRLPPGNGRSSRSAFGRGACEGTKPG